MDASEDSAFSDLESFLQCHLCNKEITDPKFLPCFHHFCLNCIERYIKDAPSSYYKCPKCETEFQIGEDGVAGLETDSHSENLKECRKLQLLLKDSDQIRECFCCSQECAPSGYCFKCPGFLCAGCRHIHENNKIAKDHKAAMRVISDETGSITIEELIRLKGLPRCKTHPSETVRLCCESCHDEIICVECSLHEHSGHKTVNIDEAASDRFVKLDEQIDLLRQYVVKMTTIAFDMETSRVESFNTMEEEKMQIKKLQEDIQVAKKEIKEEDFKAEEKKSGLILAEKMDIRALKKEMEQKIDKIKVNYEKQFDERKKETRLRIKQLEKSRDTLTKRLHELEINLDAFHKSVEERMEYLASTKRKITKINRLTMLVQTMKDTMAGLQRTANSCIIAKISRAVSSEMNTLIQELRKDYPRILQVTSVKVEKSEVSEEVEMSVQQEATVTITQSGESRLHVEAMTGLKDGNVVLLCKERYYSPKDRHNCHILIVDIKGKIVSEMVFKVFQRYFRILLASLGRNKVVVCDHRQFFVIDVHVKDLSYKAKAVEEIISKSSDIKNLSCMTTDQRTHRLFICCGSMVYITDTELQLYDSFRIEGIGRCDAIAILNDLIFTCNTNGKEACALTVEGRLRHRLRCPAITRCEWVPRKICTDERKYVYILWEGGKRGNLVVQYEQNNSNLLAFRLVDWEFDFFSVLRVDEEEKLVLGNREEMSLLIYGLQRKVSVSRGTF